MIVDLVILAERVELTFSRMPNLSPLLLFAVHQKTISWCGVQNSYCKFASIPLLLSCGPHLTLPSLSALDLAQGGATSKTALAAWSTHR